MPSRSEDALPPDYPADPRTLSEQLLRRRLDLWLSQREVTEAVGANIGTVVTWEKDREEPGEQYLPADY